MDEPRAALNDSNAINQAVLDRRINETYDRVHDQLVSLRDHLDTRLAASQVALDAAKSALEARLSTGDEQLLIHVEAQKVSVAAALAALNQLLNERDKATDIAETRQRESMERSDKALSARLSQMNEFRTQINLERATYMTREANDAETRRLSELIERNRTDILEQRSLIVPQAHFNSILEEWGVWRSDIDRRFEQLSGGTISRKSLDDLLTPLANSVDSMQRWQFKIAGALVVISVILPGIIALAVYMLTRTAVPVEVPVR